MFGGMPIDENLTWEAHIQNISKSLATKSKTFPVSWPYQLCS